MKGGDLVRCTEGFCLSVDGGAGIVLEIKDYDPDCLSVHVQWAEDNLWYHIEDLEIINENS
jgi:hypothetical protein